MLSPSKSPSTPPTSYPYTAFVGSGMPVISQAQFADCADAAASICEAQNTAPLGTGPYRIVSFKTNEEAVYERNPFYRGEVPYFDRVVLKGGGDAISAARAVLETGEADYAWNLQVEPEALAGLEAAGQGKVVSAFASLVERIVVNQTNPAPELDDNRSEYLDGQNPHPFLTFTPIPQAMSMAIDRSLISERLYGFAAEPICNLIAGPPRYASAANDGCLSQDIEGANRLLDDNGVIDTDGDGIREYNGVPLRITYQTSANSIRQDTQALIRDWWRRIGIETELAQHDASVFFGGIQRLTQTSRIAGSSRTCRCTPAIPASTRSSLCPVCFAVVSRPGTTTGPAGTTPGLATRSTTNFSPNLPKPVSGRSAPRWSSG